MCIYVYIMYIHKRGEDYVDILISTHSKTPLFQQIKEQIQQHIFTGRLQEGDALPSIRALAKEVQVSVITTKRAYEELERDGYVVSTVGKGTFVAGQQKHILKEWQLRDLENNIEKIVQTGKQIGLTKQEMIELFNVYYEEDI